MKNTFGLRRKLHSITTHNGLWMLLFFLLIFIVHANSDIDMQQQQQQQHEDHGGVGHVHGDELDNQQQQQQEQQQEPQQQEVQQQQQQQQHQHQEQQHQSEQLQQQELQQQEKQQEPLEQLEQQQQEQEQEDPQYHEEQQQQQQQHQQQQQIDEEQQQGQQEQHENQEQQDELLQQQQQKEDKIRLHQQQVDEIVSQLTDENVEQILMQILGQDGYEKWNVKLQEIGGGEGKKYPDMGTIFSHIELDGRKYHEQQKQQQQQQQNSFFPPTYYHRSSGDNNAQHQHHEPPRKKHVPFFQDDFGVYHLNHLDEIHPPMMILLLYSPSCSKSTELLTEFQKASQLVQEYFRPNLLDEHHFDDSTDNNNNASTTTTSCVCCFGQLDPTAANLLDASSNDTNMTKTVTSTVWKQIQLHTYPTMLFLVKKPQQPPQQQGDDAQEEEEDEQFYILEYVGPQTTAQDIAYTVLHYYIRLFIFSQNPPLPPTATSEEMLKKKKKRKQTNKQQPSDHRQHKEQVVPLIPQIFDTVQELKQLVTKYELGLRYSMESMIVSPFPSSSSKVTTAATTANAEQRQQQNNEDGEKVLLSLEEEQEIMSSLLSSLEEDFILLVQCRGGSNNNIHDTTANHRAFKKLEHLFYQMSRILSNRRDVLFLSVNDCTDYYSDNVNENNNGIPNVIVWRLPTKAISSQEPQLQPTITTESLWGSGNNDDDQWKYFPQAVWHPDDDNNQGSISALKEFIVRQVTPTVVWFDRQITAPILFTESRKVHAFLFLDWPLRSALEEYVSEDGSLTRSTIGTVIERFHATCQQASHSDYYRTANNNNEMICAICQSTDVRMLQAFGIDIWTPLDMDFTTTPPEKNYTTKPRILPKLVIMDQRQKQQKESKRQYEEDHDHYYRQQELQQQLYLYTLSSPQIFDPDGITNFMNEFFHGRLIPDSNGDQDSGTSSSSSSRTIDDSSLQSKTSTEEESGKGQRKNIQKNSHDVVIATSIQHIEEYPQSIIFVTNPTCGHCQRFNILFNELSDLIHYFHWDSWLTLIKIHVKHFNNYYIENNSDGQAEGDESSKEEEEMKQGESRPPLLPVSIRWVPDVFYYNRESSTYIRYYHHHNTKPSSSSASSTSHDGDHDEKQHGRDTTANMDGDPQVGDDQDSTKESHNTMNAAIIKQKHRQQMEGGVGQLNDPMELIDWILDVTNADARVLLELMS